ncbi:MAG: hypothetical protein LBH26_08825 [Treponema sp.]|jgi:hypothetical protein|nr:hypothetical protein [Treponema sp.]
MDKWYERVFRYGQTNLTEIDPEICDLGFWREFWKKTGTQGIIVNAGGIVAYYPSRFGMHYRAARLGDRDFFGDFVAEGRRAGLAILARMDINRAVEDFYRARPDWFSRRRDGSPFCTQGRYLSCVNSGYYREYVPELLAEIIERYHPDGFTDNSWTGIPRGNICYCGNCKRDFREYSGYELPEKEDCGDPVYRKWIEWSYKCRTRNWDLFNKVCAEKGGPDCLWIGMIGANFAGGLCNFVDIREIAKRAKVLLVDSQGRDGNGFEQNSLNGLLLHQMIGWDKIITESMAAYTRGVQAYRRAASSALELHLWMLEGIAGGISPWWHIVGGVQEDRRIFDRPLPILEWHRKHEAYLYNRVPVADAGILWNQANVEYFGAAKARERVGLAWRGLTAALTRAGITFLPVNANDIPEQARGLKLLILPELGLLTEDQERALEAFCSAGGNLLVFGSAGIMEGDGSPLPASRLEKLLGLSFKPARPEELRDGAGWENPVLHNYLRIERPEHPVFKGFGKTATLPMGGEYRDIEAGADVRILATHIPAYPIYPPEFAWTSLTHTDQPVITEYAPPGRGKALYAAWDLDAAYGRTGQTDQGDLLGNMAEYLLEDRASVRVSCDAYIDFKVYRQENRIIIHLINLNYTGFPQAYAEKILPLGPVKISLRIPDFSPAKVRASEDGAAVSLKTAGGICSLELDRLGLHQLLIVE